MIAVIQCAGSKKKGTGYFVDGAGSPLVFVARPDLAPASARVRHVHPDGPASGGGTWRDEVVAYNKETVNPLALHTAWDLYEPPAYRRLVSRLGVQNVFVLSAGWGLVRADFKLPQYDITFNTGAKKKRPWTHRRKSDSYHDFCQLPGNTSDQVFYFGGHDYVGLFCELTSDLQAPRTVYYKSVAPPRAPGCQLERFPARRDTNWHYDCVDWFVSQA